MSWEGKTMLSVTSSSKRVNGWFNGTLFLKNFKRFWPIWLCYGLYWFFLLPVGLLNNSRWERQGFYFPRGFILDHLSGGMLIAFGMGILCAMALFSYLYNSRSAGFYHSLPIRREGLFLTNYLSGVAFFTVPILVIAVITGVTEALTCGFDLPSVFTWAWSQFWGCLFFFSFAVFCAMFTGHVLALPVFYGILNFLAMALTYVFSSLVGEFLFGYTDNSLMNSVGKAAQWLTPVVNLATKVGYDLQPNGLYTPSGMGLVFIYGLAGLALAGCALAVYRRRQLERAGEMVTVGWARPLFKYGVAFC